MRSLLATSLVTSFVASTLLACSLASPTYITANSDQTSDDDAGTTSSSSSSSSSSSGAAPAPAGTCATDDYDKPDVSKLTACGNGQGHCIDKAKVDHAELFTACPDATQLCVPDNVVTAAGTALKSCKVALLSNAAGGCVNADLIPSIAASGGGALGQDVCDSGQKCVPCVNPGDKANTPFCQPIGVHKNACTSGSAADAGPPPAPAAPCCSSGGKSNGVCIAEAQIPADSRDQTQQLDCTTGNKCVPAALVNGAGVKCDGGFLGKGICLDKCFDTSGGLQGVFLSQDICQKSETCVPCSAAKLMGQNIPGCG